MKILRVMFYLEKKMSHYDNGCQNPGWDFGAKEEMRIDSYRFVLVFIQKKVKVFHEDLEDQVLSREKDITL